MNNGMVAPLVPLAVRGVLWYQGENNAGTAADAEQYLVKMKTLAKDWSDYFGAGQPLPFYFVQLAAWQPPSDDPAGGDSWALLRDAQRRCHEAIPHSGMAVAIDIGNAADIHPKNKQDVGERLARWALANEYGQENLTPSGPLFRELELEGGTAIVHFDYAANGLMTASKSGKEPAAGTDAPVGGFAVAGEGRRWRWADARIEGETVVVSHPEIKKPVAVRYAFSANPVRANLYNTEGLPASPFRTDNW